MKTSSSDNVPSTGLNPQLSTEAMPDADAHSPRSFVAVRQARHQVEQAHEEKLRQRGARIRAANEAVSAYLRESGTRDYQRAFGYIQRTRPELFAQTQVPARCRTVANSSEQARQERLHRRWERIQAANDAVDEYMRTSGTTNYQAAFNHIERTRPELFADMQVPPGLPMASIERIANGATAPAVANDGNKGGDPYHDILGRFTTREGAVAPHGRGHQADGGVHLFYVQADEAKEKKPLEEYKVLYPITAGASAQKTKTSECVAAAACEIVAQIAKLRAAKGERMPEGASDTLQAIESYINEYRVRKGKPRIDFSGYQPAIGATIGDARAVLEEKFNVQTQLIPINQIPDQLKQGPILVAVGLSPTDAHAEVIVGVAGPQSYYVYNPLAGNHIRTIAESEIAIAEDKDKKTGKVISRTPVVYAVSSRK